MSQHKLSGPILILGAGELGMPMLRAFSRQAAGSGGEPVSALLRPSTSDVANPAKQDSILELDALGVKLVFADIASASIAELAALFCQFDTVVSCIGFAGGSGTQVKLTQAVLNSGVRRYVPWQFGVDYDLIGRGSGQDLFDEQLDVRDMLRAQKQTEWIIVSTGMFTSFLFEPGFGVIDLANDIVHALGSWKNAVTVTTPDDIAYLTVEILFAEPRMANQVVYIAGDTLTYEQLADTVDAVLGRKLNRVEWDVSSLRAVLARDPDNSLRKYRLVFAVGCGVSWDASTTFNSQRSISTTDVSTWARKNLIG